ncbi:MAG: peptide chain release factor N(5)-glutamine methyltransferase [Chitinophagales bacterium]|nr:peptide chain release factor N(5)-glutamine methyltransferase [Chitinophagales bacterium]
MTIAELQQQYWEALKCWYDLREAKAITRLVFENELQLNATKLSLERFRQLTIEQQKTLTNILNKLIEGVPVQYVLREADFCGLKFYVNKNVLIPRPETEELVEWIVSENRQPKSEILDIGTGSGCIAIALAKKLPQAHITATDISEEALKVARINNTNNQATVNFIQHNVLREVFPANCYDVVVSNPPYIPESETGSLAQHVVKHEPHLALFSFDVDGLKFYRRIATLAFTALKPTGKLFFEIHKEKARVVTEILQQAGFTNIEVRKDLSGSDRMVKAEKR